MNDFLFSHLITHSSFIYFNELTRWDEEEVYFPCENFVESKRFSLHNRPKQCVMCRMTIVKSSYPYGIPIMSKSRSLDLLFHL